MFLTDAGRGPVNLLELRSSILKPVKFPINSGRGPVKLFRLRSRATKLVSCATRSGSIPLREQPGRRRTVREGSIATTWGQSGTVLRFTEPRLRYLSKRRRASHDTSVEYAAPILLMLKRSRYCSCVRFPRWGGTLPWKPMPERLRYLRFLRELKNSGMRPVGPLRLL
jgi:hypothetical protein